MKKTTLVLIIVIVIITGSFAWWLSSLKWYDNIHEDYYNTKYNFGFQYSPDLNILGDAETNVIMLYNTENSPGDGGLPDGIKMDIMVLENYDNLSLESWVEQVSQMGPEQEVLMEETITIRDIKAIQKTFSLSFDNLNEGAPISIYFLRENNVFMLNYLGREPDYSENLKEFQWLLSSLYFEN